MSFRHIITIFSLVVFAITFFGIPKESFALSITPIRYEISGNPGETLEKEMTLLNETKNPQTLYASFANFEAQGDTGSPSFIEPTDGLGTWMTTEQASINLLPGQQKVMPFKITIPKDAEPGGYFAVIFWGTAPNARPGEVSVGTQTGLLVLLTVNGAVEESAGLVDFQTQGNTWFYKQLPVGFQYRFSNQGNDRVKPAGSVVVRSIFGWRVKKVNVNPVDGNVLPGTTRKFMPEWSKRDSVDTYTQKQNQEKKYSFVTEVKDQWHNFALGIFRAKIEAVFGTTAQEVTSKSLYFIVFPFELILVAGLLFIVLFFVLRTLLKKYNDAIIKKAEEQFRKTQSNS